MITYKHNKTANLILDFAQMFLLSGAEISSVEESICRLAKSFGASKVDAFVITSLIMTNIDFEDGSEISCNRRITQSASNDFTILEKLNQLQREQAQKHYDAETFESILREIGSHKISSPRSYFGSFLASGCSAVFFGGIWADGLVAGIYGIVVCCIQKILGKKIPNTIMSGFLSSFIVGLLIYITSKAIPVLHSDKIIIGDIVLLIPGISITNSVKDMIVGNMLSGMIKFVESLLKTGALVLGFMLAMTIAGV